MSTHAHATRVSAIRHGQTAWNVDTRIQGQLDIGLNAHGLWQAQRVAQALRDEPIDAIYSSDLDRAHATARAIAAPLGLPVRLEPGLRERGFGRFEGHTFGEIESRWPQEAHAWRQRNPQFEPPGGESLARFQQRVLACVQPLVQGHVGQHIVLVAHGGVMDVLYRAATGQDLSAARSWALENAAINRLLWSEQGFALVGWADTRHLEPNASAA